MNPLNLLARWRLSRHHDDGRDLSPALRARLDRSAPLARRARSLDQIDRELSDHAPVELPPAELRRRTLTAISEMPRSAPAPARAPLWPVLACLSIAAMSLMLFVARPWQAPHGGAAGPDSYAAGGQISLVDDRIQRETDALVDDTRRLANRLFRDALPFAPPR